MKPPKKPMKPDPDDDSGRFAAWVGTGIVLALIALVLYVDNYGR